MNGDNRAFSQKTSLRILPEAVPLRRSGPFLEGLNWPSEGGDNQPRALRGLARIVDGGLCHRCGSCVGICPTGVLDLDEEEYPRVKNLAACTDCDLCVRVCPGDEFDYHGLNRELYGAEGDIRETHGTFRRAVIAHAADAFVREHSTSGGLITAILLHLFDSGQIDGAVVVGSDQARIWKGRPRLARSRGEIMEAMKSKYAIVSTNSVYTEIRETPGRYAVVGLPCQMHGLVKACRLDERLRERIVLSIGLFCHAAIEHEAFEIIWQSLGEKREEAVRFISRIGKHPGTPHLELRDGTLYPVYFPSRVGYRPSSMEMINILYRLYTPSRCLTCFDALSEFADIAVGDPWLAPPDKDVDFLQGWSFALLRSERGQRVYEQVLASGCIAGRDLTRREALSCNEMMATEKRWRAFRVIETHRRQGKPVPQYHGQHYRFPRHRGLQFVKTEIHMLTHALCYMPRLRPRVLKFFLGAGGYWLLWLNSFRRQFRFWRRDSAAALKRRLLGRS